MRRARAEFRSARISRYSVSWPFGFALSLCPGSAADCWRRDAARVGGESFNASDLITDTHDILFFVKQVRECPHPLPHRAETAAVAAMECGKIRALGWVPGGAALFADTVTRLAGYHRD